MTVPLVHWEGTSVTLLQLVTLWRENMDLVSMSLEVSHSRWAVVEQSLSVSSLPP